MGQYGRPPLALAGLLVSVRPSVRTQYLDANVSKTV